MSLAAGPVGEMPGAAQKRFDQAVWIAIQQRGVEHEVREFCKQSAAAVTQQPEKMATGCDNHGPVGQEQTFADSFADRGQRDGSIDRSNGRGLVGGVCFCTHADSNTASQRLKAGFLEDGFSHFSDGSLRLATHLMEIAVPAPVRGVKWTVQGDDKSIICLRGNADGKEREGLRVCWVGVDVMFSP